MEELDAMANEATYLFTGDPIEDMELAKMFVARHPDVDIEALISIAANQSNPSCSRIAAIYDLGFVDDGLRSDAALANIPATDRRQLPFRLRPAADESAAHQNV